LSLGNRFIEDVFEQSLSARQYSVRRPADQQTVVVEMLGPMLIVAGKRKGRLSAAQRKIA